jgi:hypothetical protein
MIGVYSSASETVPMTYEFLLVVLADRCANRQTAVHAPAIGT